MKPDNPDCELFETWLRPEEVAADDSFAYWNDEEVERVKPLYTIIRKDSASLERHLASDPYVRQLQKATRLLNSRGVPLSGTGADLGCGNMTLVPHLISLPTIERLYCVDYSRYRLTTLGPDLLKHFPQVRRKVVLCLGDFCRLQLSNNSLDFVILSASFHHAYEPNDFLLEIRRVLKTQGKVLILGEQPLTLRLRLTLLAQYLTRRQQPATFPLRRKVLIDRTLGDHGYSRKEYLRMFAEARFAVCDEGNKDGLLGFVLSKE